MKIAVLSGKGGTGKTLLSVNMASAIGNSRYIDCDVEEPNGHLFFKPQKVTSREVAVKIPVVDKELCDGCHRCVDFCRFNALALVGDNLMVFEEICHSCGGCLLVCPKGALKEKEKAIGRIECGVSGGVQVATGILNTGEASGVPIIDALLDTKWDPAEFTFIDCPPGSACIVMESIKDADYCILVAEPTLFGVHNLDMVYELVKLFNKPHGVVINKYFDGENPAEKFCIEKGIDILGKIPFDKELGAMNSEGLIVARESEKYRQIFMDLLQKVIGGVHHEAAVNPQR
ncbi:MAG TPA: ATP-binding protein [Clostridia bacterium]|nr:ATP-binding protein [Clostridia bacterium]